MIQTLTIEDVLTTLSNNPEQRVFDWKRDFVVPSDDDKRGEFLKDVAAIANSITTSDGFVFYGVDPRQPNPIVGIAQPYDDARLQQLVRGKIEPVPEFLYYQLTVETKIVAVLQVLPAKPRPHIFSVDMGKVVRRGQVVLRRGSSTDGATIEDLLAMFYDHNSGYFPRVIQNMRIQVDQQRAHTAHLAELRAQADNALRDMEMVTGVPLRALRGQK